MTERGDGASLDGPGFITLVRSLADAWRALDVEAAVACFTPDAVYMEPPAEQLITGRAQLRSYFRPLRHGTYLRIDNWWFDEVAQRGAIEFTFGEDGDSEADHGVAILDIADGRIRSWREYLRPGPAAFERFVAIDGKEWRWHTGNYPTGTVADPGGSPD